MSKNQIASLAALAPASQHADEKFCADYREEKYLCHYIEDIRV